MRVLGLDGFKKGWVVVALSDDKPEISFHADIADALSKPFDRAFVDIPIGMNDDGQRCCDNLARRMLGRNSSRVFNGARRWLWEEFDDPDDANNAAKQRGQSGISRQLWHLGSKIVEVDRFLEANPNLNIFECHPELIFLRINSNEELPSKKSAQGILLRMKLIEPYFPIRWEWIANEPCGQAASLDDVLDACACALAAKSPAGCLPSGEPPKDKKQLKMQIWF